MAAPLVFLVALLCPRLGGRPGDTLTYDEATGEAVLVRRMTLPTSVIQEKIEAGTVIPHPGAAQAADHQSPSSQLRLVPQAS